MNLINIKDIEDIKNYCSNIEDNNKADLLFNQLIIYIEKLMNKSNINLLLYKVDVLIQLLKIEIIANLLHTNK